MKGTKKLPLSCYWETALEHAAGDAACGRDWSCACGACRIVRREGIWRPCEIGCTNPDECKDCTERELKRPCGPHLGDECRHPPGECHHHAGQPAGTCEICDELTYEESFGTAKEAK